MQYSAFVHVPKNRIIVVCVRGRPFVGLIPAGSSTLAPEYGTELLHQSGKEPIRPGRTETLSPAAGDQCRADWEAPSELLWPQLVFHTSFNENISTGTR